LPFYRWCLTAVKPILGYPRELRHLGDHLVKRRLDLGLRQKEAARRLGAARASGTGRPIGAGFISGFVRP